jgi:hypothetical protein
MHAQDVIAMLHDCGAIVISANAEMQPLVTTIHENGPTPLGRGRRRVDACAALDARSPPAAGLANRSGRRFPIAMITHQR